jgi:hypothetical protein
MSCEQEPPATDLYFRFFLRDFVSEYAIAKTPNVSRLITTKLTSAEKM